MKQTDSTEIYYYIRNHNWRHTMGDMILILIFVILLAFPGFYIIMHSIFPHARKKTLAYIAALLTVLLVCVLLVTMVGAV